MHARTKENNTEANLRQLALGGQTVKNLHSLACQFELNQSEHKSSQTITSTHKSWRNGVASYRKLNIATPFEEKTDFSDY